MQASVGVPEATRAANALRGRIGTVPRVGIILGSGLGGAAGAIEDAMRISYQEIDGFPATAVAGHAGELIAGRLANVPVVALSGRFHVYEGYDVAVAALPVRLLHALGARVLILSNASGALRREFIPGTIALLQDHLNLMFRNPLAGALQAGDQRFPDMSAPYDAGLRVAAMEAAHAIGVGLPSAVYAALPGPSYETPAEVRMLARLGADLVGMSTVPEVIVARASGMRVLAFSCVTNYACGLADAPLTHEDVLAATARAATTLARIVREVVARV